MQAYLRLQEYDYDRTNFLARAVHDLRAPLTAVNGYCGLLLEEMLGPLTPDQRDALDRIQHSSRRLSRVAAAMSVLTEGHAVEARAEVQPSSLEACIQRAISGVQTLSEDRDIGIAVDLREPAVPMWFEPGEIEQLMVHLLEAACTYGPRGGIVEIAGYPVRSDRQCAPKGNGVPECGEYSKSFTCFRVDVSDRRPPIPARLLPFLFDENTSNCDSEERSGGGLSMAICRMIVRSHGGHIWASSELDGVTFSFVIPVQPGTVGERTPEDALAADSAVRRTL